MNYLDICIIGWNLNALMFVINFLMAIRVISTQDRTKLQEESVVLKELKDGNFNLKELSAESFDRLNKVLDSLDETLVETQNLINEIEQSPSDLIFKQKSIKYGPGEVNEK